VYPADKIHDGITEEMCFWWKVPC